MREGTITALTIFESAGRETSAKRDPTQTPEHYYIQIRNTISEHLLVLLLLLSSRAHLLLVCAIRHSETSEALEASCEDRDQDERHDKADKDA
jgi:hypothetical protein